MSEHHEDIVDALVKSIFMNGYGKKYQLQGAQISTHAA